MRKISLILATVMLLSTLLASCGTISFVVREEHPNEEIKHDIQHVVVGEGEGKGEGGTIIQGGNGIQNGNIDKPENSDDIPDDTSDTTPDTPTGDPNVPDNTPDNPTGGTVNLNGVKIGDYITFGQYEQDNNLSNGKEAIEWLVLDVKDGRALVISRYALDCLKMHPTYDTISWETCWMRGWLNNDFMNTAFSSEQQNQIALTSLSVDPEPVFDGPDWGYNPGNPTQDKLFFLTVTEAERYFANDDARSCLLTPYTASKDVNKAGGYADWWLRNGGAWEMMFSVVSWSGYIYTNGVNSNSGGYSIRPAMWLKIG